MSYLPPYSPDLNPIEKLFAKLKALLRKAATRTTDTLWNEIAQLLDGFPPSECTHYFKSSGYVCTSIENALAFGSSRKRVLRQLLTEATLILLNGGKF